MNISSNHSPPKTSEVLGSVVARFDEGNRAEIAFLLERWNEIKASHGITLVAAGRLKPRFEEVWLRVIDHLIVMMTPGIEEDDMRI
ncbi:BZ3500_MvSof-1268-A1-R1_Chr8-2g10169 [Microbotryum saponariae]|uniref:BZ3500_MvSof-1268-A1-R1_Chr8-2g10169 protein n=1 Tax=Microbotryum saponariae TaxID=289078 RepID=A0A2X0LB59_9BASI|nr:BZ3500_MvSof-1268-A1-R1_Chr8-2g10169 [Microbotryum saponariae]SDA01928.1 BZ3501_MvSof-1269-A2-R1_Chr8-2g09920 [Microbotryum saponariae]